MAGAMPQLNEAETKFFESKGEDLAPTLSEGMPERESPETGNDKTELPTDKPEPSTPEKTGREERFVPLQALQEERAEKKQLREELKAYREWQAQLAQRLQQVPQPTAPQAPDPEKQPLDYINHVLGSMQASTQELQQWRQQQESAAQQRSTLQQYANWASTQEQEFIKSQPEYHDAYWFATETRDKELQALGYMDAATRASIVRMNTAEIVNNAIQSGRNPAELVWEYAQARGFTSRPKRSSGNEEAQAKIAAGLQAVGGKLNQGGAAGDSEVSAKDLAGITDPDEFEKAWKRVFGKRR